MQHKGMLLGASAAVTATMVAAGPLPQAHAVATPVRPQPITIVVSAPTTQIAMAVDSSARRHIVTLTDPRVGVVAQGTSRYPRLTVYGSVASARLRTGCQTWILHDGDGTRRPVGVCVVARSILTMTRLTGLHRSYQLTGTAVRFDGRHYAPLAYTPVHVQEQRRGRWVTVRTVLTNGRGVIRATVGHDRGPVTVRLSMPQSNTGGGASSDSALAVVH